MILEPLNMLVRPRLDIQLNYVISAYDIRIYVNYTFYDKRLKTKLNRFLISYKLFSTLEKLSKYVGNSYGNAIRYFHKLFHVVSLVFIFACVVLYRYPI